MKQLFFISFGAILLLFPFNRALSQISLSSLNDFEDGTTQGWQVGSGIQPVNIPTGGPNGANDNYLKTTSDGAPPQNARLVIFNQGGTWAGNWTTAGVNYISLMARNSGATNLTLRISLDGGGGRISLTNGIPLATGSGWVRLNFPVSAANFSLVGGFNAGATLANVSTMRILHSAFPAWQGDPIIATLDLDVISAQSAPLAISLEYFNVLPDRSKNFINWKTLTETNSNYFEVERSKNGTNWEVLEKLAAAGNSNSPLLYKTLDLYPYKGVSYYRLKEVDKDNRNTYSPVRQVVFSGAAENSLSAYPNPSSSFFILTQRTALDISSITIINSAGLMVSNKVKVTTLSSYKVRVDVSQLPDGIYYLKTKSGSCRVNVINN